MFICDEATQHKERATIPKGFSWLLRRVQPIFPNPCQDLWFRCILSFFFLLLLLYEEWSNQAWKCVSSVCWRGKRDFQNNPLSRWEFLMFFFFHTNTRCVSWECRKWQLYRDAISSNERQNLFVELCVMWPHIWSSSVIIQSLDRSYFVKWNAELLRTLQRSWSDTCK